MEWTKNSKVHMLIRNCVFHYELEQIHPFADGNGRIGRQWHTLLLSKWNPTYARLPVESMIQNNQRAYYDAINISNALGSSTIFDAVEMSEVMDEGNMDKETFRWLLIKNYLETHGYIMNADVWTLCNASAATTNRILAGFATEGKLVKYREGSHRAYGIKH